MSEKPNPSPEEPVNFAELSERRKRLRETRRELEDEDSPDFLKQAMAEELEGIDTQAQNFNIEEIGGLNKAKESLRAEKDVAEGRMWIDEGKITAEIGATYEEFRSTQSKIQDLEDFEMRRMREGVADPHSQKAHENLLRTIRAERDTLQNKIDRLKIENPMEAHAFDLVRYKRGLHEPGHIAATPSVEGYMHEIGLRMISGKPAFLHGPTGTGKTSLARFAAEHFTGNAPEIIYCNPQTRESNIWGGKGLRPAGPMGAIETYFDWGPLAKAVRDGKVAIFDEFTALPKEQMAMIKGIMSAKPGDEVAITGNGNVTIHPAFQMLFTANLKSEKNPERQDIPPEMANEFDQNNLKINYTPKDEAYDIMLARLLNPDGSINLSDEDLNVTLPKLCEAIAEIQIAYTDKPSEETSRLTGTAGARGRAQGLKKLVMNQRTVESILAEWKIEKSRDEGKPFIEFLDQRLKMSLTFEEYPEADRIMAAKILASKGLLRTLSAAELNLPANTFDFDAAKKQRGKKAALTELLTKSAAAPRHSLKEVSELDPFELREKRMAEAAKEFAGVDEEEAKVSGAELTEERKEEITKEVTASLSDAYVNFWSLAKKDLPSFKPEFVDPANFNYAARAADIDKAKFGEYFLNSEVQGVDFETAKVFVPDLSGMVGKKLHEVFQHVLDTYADKYHIPGLEYWKWLRENQDKIDQIAPELKDGNWYYCPGSSFRYSDGDWYAPFVYWFGSELKPNGHWLGRDWRANERVLLLEK